MASTTLAREAATRMEELTTVQRPAVTAEKPMDLNYTTEVSIQLRLHVLQKIRKQGTPVDDDDRVYIMQMRPGEDFYYWLHLGTVAETDTPRNKKYVMQRVDRNGIIWDTVVVAYTLNAGLYCFGSRFPLDP